MSRILIVEVDPFVRSSLTRALERRGHSVLATECAREAVVEMTSCDVDLVMASQELGTRLDGTSLLDVIERMRPECACVLMSSGTRPEITKRSRHTVLEKPFSYDAVARIVGSLDARHAA